MVRFQSSLRQFYGRHHDLVNRYRRSVSQMNRNKWNENSSPSSPLVHFLSVIKLTLFLQNIYDTRPFTAKTGNGNQLLLDVSIYLNLPCMGISKKNYKKRRIAWVVLWIEMGKFLLFNKTSLLEYYFKYLLIVFSLRFSILTFNIITSIHNRKWNDTSLRKWTMNIMNYMNFSLFPFHDDIWREKIWMQSSHWGCNWT